MVQMMLTLAIGLTLFLAFALVASAFLLRPSAEAQRLQEVVASSRPDQRRLSRRQIFQEGLLGLSRNIRALFGFRSNSRLRDRLLTAGIRNPSAEDLFFAAQCFVPLVGIFAASFIPSNTLFWAFSLAMAGWIAPDIWLTERTRRRRRKILRSLPDAIDLLVICVEAGLGLDQALIRVSEELALGHPEIHEELVRVQLEQRAGRPRLEAWQSLATRTRIPEFAAFVSMLTQTDRFGTPIVKALIQFADDLRLKRRQRVEQAAAKTKIKIIFPLVFFIFPTLFIVLLAPALMSIARELSTLHK